MDLFTPHHPTVAEALGIHDAQDAAPQAPAAAPAPLETARPRSRKQHAPDDQTKADLEKLAEIERAFSYAAEMLVSFTNADDNQDRHAQVEKLLGSAWNRCETVIEDIRRIITLKQGA